MAFQRLISRSPTELFVDELKKMIFSGELSVGERLPAEKQLSEKMHVSRAVVSNGFKTLERQGFLRIVPRKGVYVADYLTTGNLESDCARNNSYRRLRNAWPLFDSGCFQSSRRRDFRGLAE